jgi:hypothetical protein
MSIKPRQNSPILLTVIITPMLLVGLLLLSTQRNYVFGWIAVIAGLTLLTVGLLARRRTSTTFERIIALSPRDERDSAKIQWGFALVGKITLVFITLVGLAILAVYATSLALDDCHTTANGEVCVAGLPWYVTSIFEVVFGIFAAALLAAAVASSLKRD